jgi:hypothetical protein
VLVFVPKPVWFYGQSYIVLTCERRVVLEGAVHVLPCTIFAQLVYKDASVADIRLQSALRVSDMQHVNTKNHRYEQCYARSDQFRVAPIY